MVAYHSDRVHEIPASEFFLGPGKTALLPHDFLVAVRFPVPPAGSCGSYLKLGRNKAGDLAIVGVAVYGWPDLQRDGQSGPRFRIALASVAPVPMRAHAAEDLLAQHPLAEPVLQWAAGEAAESTSPIDDVRASGAYRKAMVRNLVLRGVREVADRIGQGRK
jgi:carbon-monoxide dehydrogenase medium subunit